MANGQVDRVLDGGGLRRVSTASRRRSASEPREMNMKPTTQRPLSDYLGDQIFKIKDGYRDCCDVAPEVRCVTDVMCALTRAIDESPNGERTPAIFMSLLREAVDRYAAARLTSEPSKATHVSDVPAK
jgi:hypothetical protein